MWNQGLLTPLTAILTVCSSVLGKPTSLQGRDVVGSAIFGAYYDGDTPLVSMSGFINVPEVMVPPGGDPTLQYQALMGIGLQDSSTDFDVIFGLVCDAGSVNECAAFYEYKPTVPGAIIFSDTFFPSVGDMLEFTITVLNNKTIALSVYDYATEDLVTQEFASAVAANPYTTAEWVMQALAGPPYIDFGAVEWYGTAAIGVDDSQLDPSMAQEVSNGQSGGAVFGVVTPGPGEVMFQYV